MANVDTAIDNAQGVCNAIPEFQFPLNGFHFDQLLSGAHGKAKQRIGPRTGSILASGGQNAEHVHIGNIDPTLLESQETAGYFVPTNYGNTSSIYPEPPQDLSLGRCNVGNNFYVHPHLVPEFAQQHGYRLSSSFANNAGNGRSRPHTKIDKRTRYKQTPSSASGAFGPSEIKLLDAFLEIARNRPNNATATNSELKTLARWTSTTVPVVRAWFKMQKYPNGQHDPASARQFDIIMEDSANFHSQMDCMLPPPKNEELYQAIVQDRLHKANKPCPKNRSPGGILKCPKRCGASWPLEKVHEFARHIQCTRPGDFWLCPYCHTIYNRGDHLKSHLKRHGSEFLPSISVNKLVEQAKIRFFQFPERCGFCHFSNTWEVVWQDHIINHFRENVSLESWQDTWLEDYFTARFHDMGNGLPVQRPDDQDDDDPPLSTSSFGSIGNGLFSSLSFSQPNSIERVEDYQRNGASNSQTRNSQRSRSEISAVAVRWKTKLHLISIIRFALRGFSYFWIRSAIRDCSAGGPSRRLNHSKTMPGQELMRRMSLDLSTTIQLNIGNPDYNSTFQLETLRREYLWTWLSSALMASVLEKRTVAVASRVISTESQSRRILSKLKGFGINIKPSCTAKHDDLILKRKWSDNMVTVDAILTSPKKLDDRAIRIEAQEIKELNIECEEEQSNVSGSSKATFVEINTSHLHVAPEEECGSVLPSTLPLKRDVGYNTAEFISTQVASSQNSSPSALKDSDNPKHHLSIQQWYRTESAWRKSKPSKFSSSIATERFLADDNRMERMALELAIGTDAITQVDPQLALGDNIKLRGSSSIISRSTSSYRAASSLISSGKSRYSSSISTAPTSHSSDVGFRKSHNRFYQHNSMEQLESRRDGENLTAMPDDVMQWPIDPPLPEYEFGVLFHHLPFKSTSMESGPVNQILEAPRDNAFLVVKSHSEDGVIAESAREKEAQGCKGSVSEVQRVAARQIRRGGACKNCLTRRALCDGGNPCEWCLKYNGKTLEQNLCGYFGEVELSLGFHIIEIQKTLMPDIFKLPTSEEPALNPFHSSVLLSSLCYLPVRFGILPSMDILLHVHNIDPSQLTSTHQSYEWLLANDEESIACPSEDFVLPAIRKDLRLVTFDCLRLHLHRLIDSRVLGSSASPCASDLMSSIYQLYESTGSPKILAECFELLLLTCSINDIKIDKADTKVQSIIRGLCSVVGNRVYITPSVIRIQFGMFINNLAKGLLEQILERVAGKASPWDLKDRAEVISAIISITIVAQHIQLRGWVSLSSKSPMVYADIVSEALKASRAMEGEQGIGRLLKHYRECSPNFQIHTLLAQENAVTGREPRTSPQLIFFTQIWKYIELTRTYWSEMANAEITKDILTPGFYDGTLARVLQTIFELDSEFLPLPRSLD